MEFTDVRRAARRFAPGPRASRVLTIIGALLLVVALAGLAVRFHTFSSATALGLVAAVPYVLLAAPVGVVLMLVARQWIGVGVAVAVSLLCVSSQVWLYTASDPPADAVPVNVLTSNLRLGQADPAAVVAAARRHSVDLLMLEELTPEAQQGLIDQGLDELLPYHESRPGIGAAGTGLWSRYPISDVQFPPGFAFPIVTAQVTIPGRSQPITVVALHMAGPVPDAGPWRSDIGRLPSVLHALSGDAAVVVGGDFNATPDTKQFRTVLRSGYSDAADQAGAGHTATYPADRWFPPLIAIDHVLAHGGPVATDVRTVSIRGSDHRGLWVRLAVPR